MAATKKTSLTKTGFLSTLDSATQNIAIKPERCFKVSYSHHDMIYFADPNHRSHYCRKGSVDAN
jgi:hypothetical protein